jgi:hypothetical protein
MYADDTNLLISAHNLDDLMRRINYVLSLVSNWFFSKKLSVNASKSCVLKFTPSKLTYCPLSLTYNGQTLSEQDVITFLGLHLDKHLSGETHLNCFLSKLGTACFITRILSHVLNTESLRVVYFAHFQSAILYGLVFWGTATNLKRVFLLQKRIIRIMLGLGPRCSCRFWFTKIGYITSNMLIYLFLNVFCCG